jgi:hypothetical protein
MPVIRSGNHQSVHLGVLQDPAKVLRELQRTLGGRIERRLRPRPAPSIRIAEPDHVYVGFAGEHSGEGNPAPAQTHEPEPDAVIGAEDTRGWGDGEGGGEGRGLLEKPASGGGIHNGKTRVKLGRAKHRARDGSRKCGLDRSAGCGWRPVSQSVIRIVILWASTELTIPELEVTIHKGDGPAAVVPFAYEIMGRLPGNPPPVVGILFIDEKDDL